MAGNGANSGVESASGAAGGQWPDLYALLGVAPDAGPELLRQRIRESYMEATANSDHRNMERRLHYQAMMERILPQCRRILLDDGLRAAYDRQSALHRDGDARAMEYAVFVNTLGNSANSGADDGGTRTAPGKRLDEDRRDEPRASETAMTARETASGPGAAASAYDALPSEASAQQASAQQASARDITSFVENLPSESVETQPSVPQPAQPSQPQSPAAILEETLPSEAPASREAPPEALPGARTASAVTSPAAPNAAGARARTPRAPRVSVGDTPKSGWNRRGDTRGKRVLSETSIRLLTGIAAAGLMFAILYFTDTSGAVVAPLRVTYASELQPFMERAEREFESSAEGAGVDIQLSPIDSRDAMHRALEGGGTPPDVWIPSESLWREQYDQVAGRHQRQRIAVARPLVLSPTVLVARSDRAAPLRRRFPNRIIASWEALRAAIIAGAPNHFGLTDPQKSASGAIARLFMAREWCQRNNIQWSANAVTRPALWQWMKGFEDNVPGYASLAGDMVQDLALGTADRYWWAIAYESDALRWMSQGKPVEIFYLPRTNYADHPFCYIERRDVDPRSAQARVQFDRFLRGPQMQKALLQNGFRPTAIEISSKVENNPFASADFKARGLRATGFRTDDKINYRILNSLNVQWSKRF